MLTLYVPLHETSLISKKERWTATGTNYPVNANCKDLCISLWGSWHWSLMRIRPADPIWPFCNFQLQSWATMFLFVCFWQQMLHCMFPPAGIFPCVYTDVHTSNVLRTEYVYRWESGKSLRASLARKVVATILRGRLSTSFSPWKWKYGSPLQCIDNSPPFTAQNLSSTLCPHKFWVLTKHVSLAACRNVFLWCQEKSLWHTQMFRETWLTFLADFA